MRGAMDNGVDNRDSIPAWGEDFFLANESRPTLGPTQPPIVWVQEADHSPQSSVEVKNA